MNAFSPLLISTSRTLVTFLMLLDPMTIYLN